MELGQQRRQRADRLAAVFVHEDDRSGVQPGLDVPAIASGIYGLIILIVILLRPEGLLPSRRRGAEFHQGVHDEPLYDATHTGQ